MASTRSATGNSKPRILSTVSTEPTHKRSSTSKKPKTTKTKANTSEPRTGGVTKKKAPATKHKRTHSVKDKVVGAVEEAVGEIENEPAKEAAGTKKKKGTDVKGARGKKSSA